MLRIFLGADRPYSSLLLPLTSGETCSLMCHFPTNGKARLGSARPPPPPPSFVVINISSRHWEGVCVWSDLDSVYELQPLRLSVPLWSVCN